MREPTSAGGQSLMEGSLEGTGSTTQEASGSGQFRIGASERSEWSADELELAPESRESAWTLCASDYQLFAAGATRPFAWDAVRLVRIESGSQVLDVASGTGEFAMAAVERGADVLATDFSEPMLSLLDRTRRKRGVPFIQTAVMDGQSLTLPSNSFDVVGSLFGLVFFPDPHKGLSEMYRVLRPGGQAVVATWATPARVELMRIVGETMMQSCLDLVERQSRTSEWTRLSQPQKLSQMLSQAGLSAVHVVELAHVWTFESVEEFARAVLRTTPNWLELYQHMSSNQKHSFTDCLCKSFRERQGNGPYAVTAQGLIAVGTKPR